MRKTGRLNDITRFLNESRKELIFYSIIWLIIYSYHRSDNTDNGKMRYEKPEFENLAKAHPLYDESDNRQCFASYAFDDNRKIEPFIDLVDDDLLKTADGQSIIFHATNCIHDGVPTINLRQACAVESAARTNPHLRVYLAFASPVGFTNFTNLPIMDALLSYKNVYLRNNDITRYAEDTVLEDWIQTDEIYKSRYYKTNVANYLRFVSMYKYGGLYLDLDTITIKNISHLGSNYAGVDTMHPNCKFINNNVLHFDTKTFVGHDLSKKILLDFMENFDPYTWAVNGVRVISRVITKHCNATYTDDMTFDRCGFQVYDRSYFYAIYHSDAFKTEPKIIDKCLETLRADHTAVFHFNNNVTKNHQLDIRKPTAYTIFAEKFCPKIFKLVDVVF